MARSQIDRLAVLTLATFMLLLRAGAASAELPGCTLSTIDKVVGVNNVPDHPESYLSSLCLPEKLMLRPDGKVRCELRATAFESPEIARRVCADSFHSQVQLAEDGSAYCTLNQLTRSQPLALQGPGFYYDETSSALARVCRGGGGVQRLGFVPDNLMYILDYLHLDLHCELASAERAGADTSEGCPIPLQTAGAARDVGKPCVLPGDPPVFDITQRYLGGPAPECGTGMCLAYGLHGSAAPDCDPELQTCLDPKAVHDRVRCTCRCSASEPGDAELCACPDGYSCEPLLRDGPAAGGYCVDAHFRPSK